MENEKYQCNRGRLIICDPHLGLSIDEPFEPYHLLPAPSLLSALVTETDEEEKVISRYFEIEGKREGESALYYPNGALKARCYYLNGKLHGPSLFFGEKGEKLSETWFYNNQKEGKTVRYYLSGNLASIERFRHDLFHSEQEYYYEGGQLKSKLFYLNGKLDGTVLLFWEDGRKKRELHFEKGIRIGEDKMWDFLGEPFEVSR